MRAPEANARADKALLVILALLLANIASPLLHPERSAAQSEDPGQVTLKAARQTSEISPNEKAARATPGSARASRAVFGALAENFFLPRVADTRALGEGPRAAREARALPGRLSPNE